MQLILPVAYLGNTSYYQLLKSGNEILIEANEYYQKQTYRNRCTIYGANGPLDLVIPVVKGKGSKKNIREARINNSESWQRTHWRSIESAYRTSPYFEFYEHELLPFYQAKQDFLFDFDLALQEKICTLLEIGCPTSFTGEYTKEYPGGRDYREYFDPRINSSDEFNFPHYTQVFETKHGFIPNLSIIDLLFACGPSAASYI